MAIGTLGALAISAGSAIAGQAANRIFNPKPDTPDFASEVDNQYQKARRRLTQQQDRQTNQVQADAVAAGVNPISAMADVIESNNQAQADLSAKAADAKAAAENKEKRIDFQQDLQKYKNRAQAIGSISSGISQAASNKAAINALKDLNEDGGDDNDGGDNTTGPSSFGGTDAPSSTAAVDNTSSVNSSGGGGSSVPSGGGGGGGTPSPSTANEISGGVVANEGELGAGADANDGEFLGGAGQSFLLDIIQNGMTDQTNPLMTQVAMNAVEGMP